MSKDEWKKLTKNEWKKWVSVVGRMLLAYALVFAQAAWAAQNQGTKDKAGPPQKAAAQQAIEKQSAVAAAQGEEPESSLADQRPSRDGLHEGIKVHGHWTIEVRNADGTLATRRDFENALLPGGATTLASVLSRQKSVGLWSIVLLGSVCQTSVGSTHDCYIAEPGIPTGGQPFVLPLNPPSANGGAFALSATLTAQLTGTIYAVGSTQLVMPPTVAPATPGVYAPNSSVNGANFTQTTITDSAGQPSPLSVSAGQTIAVTVTISFS